MTLTKPTRPNPKSHGLALAVGLFGLAVAGQVLAKCGDAPAPKTSMNSSGFMVPAVYRPDQAAGALQTVGYEWFDGGAIVGLWEFEVHLKGAQNGFPDNFLIDWGLATWHEDGTEIQFSAGRPPASGDVCMGVWEQVGKATFKLHHVALGLTPPDASGTFVGPTTIRATVTVSANGNSYSGPYSITTYPGSPDNGTEFNDTPPALVTFTGTITAHRVIAN